MFGGKIYMVLLRVLIFQSHQVVLISEIDER